MKLRGILRIEHIKIYFICIITLYATPLCSQTIVENIGFNKVELNIPAQYKKYIFSYEEGVFITYQILINQCGNSHVTLFKGKMQRLPLLHKENGYIPIEIIKIGEKVITKGIKGNFCWREDVIDDIRVCYDCVPINMKGLFDEILDSILVKKANKKES